MVPIVIKQSILLRYGNDYHQTEYTT